MGSDVAGFSLSVVVGCMGRKIEAEQFIPYTSKQLGVQDEIMLVDWDDPDLVGAWAVGLNDPHLTVVRVAPCCWFEPNRQRNVGLRHAVGEIVIVSDIDHLMPEALLAECRCLKEKTFLVAPSSVGSYGWLCCRWADWRAVNGYEEALSGYGFDDFYHRESLNQYGLRMVLASTAPYPVQREAKVRFYPDEKLTTSHHVNMRIGKALRIYSPFRGNFARNFGWGGEVLCSSEARKNAPEARTRLSREWWGSGRDAVHLAAGGSSRSDAVVREQPRLAAVPSGKPSGPECAQPVAARAAV